VSLILVNKLCPSSPVQQSPDAGKYIAAQGVYPWWGADEAIKYVAQKWHIIKKKKLSKMGRWKEGVILIERSGKTLWMSCPVN
jgi:hypothetical protein